MRNGDMISYADDRLEPCPVCGEQAFWRITTIRRGVNRTGNIPDGAKFVKERKELSGRTQTHWIREGYVIHCKTPKCICRTPKPNMACENLDDAILKWNSREYLKPQGIQIKVHE